MTTSATPKPATLQAAILQASARALRRAWTKGRRVERVAYVISAVLFAAGVAHLGVLVVSGTTWLGPLSYRKAMTFGLSFGLTLAGVAWATSFVRLRPRTRTVLLGLFGGASVVEVVLVTMQAWRGVPSHFNFETGFDAAVSATLAGGGGVLVGTAIAFTAAALRASGDTSPSMRLAVRFGFFALLVALGVGAMMIADGVALSRGGQPQLAYTQAGALKLFHAVPMHAILIVPGLAWLLRFTNWGETRRVRVIWGAIGVYSLLIVAAAIVSFTLS
jgi:hypothetical protein